jgi:hypothetical protein
MMFGVTFSARTSVEYPVFSPSFPGFITRADGVE